MLLDGQAGAMSVSHPAQGIQHLQTEIEAIRDDIAPTWLQHPLSLEQTADKYVRPSLQQVNTAVPLLFVHLPAHPCILAYLHRLQQLHIICQPMLPSEQHSIALHEPSWWHCFHSAAMFCPTLLQGSGLRFS